MPPGGEATFRSNLTRRTRWRKAAAVIGALLALFLLAAVPRILIGNALFTQLTTPALATCIDLRATSVHIQRAHPPPAARPTTPGGDPAHSTTHPAAWYPPRHHRHDRHTPAHPLPRAGPAAAPPHQPAVS
ncbi:hypothetical protein PCASD_14339 [Puccinia coronata f. sp. avenae]|uniref:Uncharacterized protein n=1 Tax=Puccinia coronata f. sp. avenae TaxID=200324 RepID=A0A2N5U3P7_9BASI|nr:hypothetical protein PCASD_14339 [Puccinia coronata f. sp. avenae]